MAKSVNSLSAVKANYILKSIGEDVRDSESTIFSYFYDHDGLFQLTLESVPAGCEEYRAFGKDFMLSAADLERLKKIYPNGEVYNMFIGPGDGAYSGTSFIRNHLIIDREIPVSLLVGKKFLRPMDRCCEDQ